MHATASPARVPATRSSLPVVIGHRGAPAYRPEHTAASFELAIDLGAEMIEPDVVVSRDGALIVRHDRELSFSTDIADRPEFAERRTVKLVRGNWVSDWFVEDFDVHELRTLRAVEALPELRPLNTAYDYQQGLMVLSEVIELARRRSTARRPIGVLVELVPGLVGVGLELPRLIVAELRRLRAAHGASPVILQSFEPAVLRRLRAELGDDGPAMVQLMDAHPNFDPLVSPAGLREVSTYAQAIGPNRNQLLLRDESGAIIAKSDLVDRAHQADLDVYVWKLQPENMFLPRHLRRGQDPSAHGDALGEARLLLNMGADGLITDVPEVAVLARAEVIASMNRSTSMQPSRLPLASAAIQ